MTLFCVDPGVQASGAAWFRDGLLMSTHYEPAFEFGGFQQFVIEMPRIYPKSDQRKGDLNDLLNLAAVVGQWEVYARYCASLKRVAPRDWKGQVPKKIMTARILSKLSVEESLKIKDVGAKTHNVIDAVGIGLWKLGRL